MIVINFSYAYLNPKLSLRVTTLLSEYEHWKIGYWGSYVKQLISVKYGQGL